MLSIRQRVQEARSSTWFITLVICYAIFVDQLFFAFILPVLPYSLPARNGVPEDQVQVWTTILVIVFGATMFLACPIAGLWTDRHSSRRIPFLVGLTILFASTVLMWLATPMSLQVLSRVGQGFADALVYIVGMSMLIDKVTTEHVAEYMGYVTLAMNIGTFVGPLLGGVVFERAGYNAVWWMMLGFVVLDALFRFAVLEKKKEDVVVKDVETVFDRSNLQSQQELSAFPIDPTLASEPEPLPAKPPTVIVTTKELGPEPEPEPEPEPGPATTSTSNPSSSTIPNNPTTSTSPPPYNLPPLLTLLTSPRMLTALYGTTIQSAIFSGFETVLSLYVRQIFAYSSLGAGLIFIPLTLPSFASPLLGRLIDRTNPRWSLVAGFVSLSPVLVGVGYVTRDSTEQKILLCALLFLIGLGITLALNPLMAEISYVVDERERRECEQRNPVGRGSGGGFGGGAYAQAYALFSMAWAIGNIAGPLMCGFVTERAGWGVMCWVLAVLSGITAVPCFVWSGGGCSGLRFWKRRKSGSPEVDV